MTKKKDDTFSENIDQSIDLAVNTLSGDIRDFLLDRVKNLGKPWPAMTEQEQRDQIYAAKDAAERLVRLTAELIAAEGRKALVGKLVKVSIKDKIQCQVDFNKEDEMRHELIDSQGFSVLLVVADAEPFTAERAPAEPTPNQSDLLANAEKLKQQGDKVTPLKPE